MSSSQSSNNSSSNSSSSQSTPVVEQSPQSAYALQLAQEAAALAQEQYQWGQQQFANNTQLTDQTVNNFLAGASTAYNQGQQDLAQYNNEFVPENRQLVQDANDYASTPRIQKNMGAAEANASQGMEAGRQNAIKDLQSYGIDPSSGRYAELDNAERLQAGAAAAGAGNQAEQQTEATGRSLRAEAIQVGETLPGQAINEINASNAGNSAAENAQLANTSVGSQILGTPEQYMGTAMQLKYPPVGQQSTSQSQGASQGSSSGGSRAQDPNAANKSTTPSGGTPRTSSGGGGGNGGGGANPSHGGVSPGIINGYGGNSPGTGGPGANGDWNGLGGSSVWSGGAPGPGAGGDWNGLGGSSVWSGGNGGGGGGSDTTSMGNSYGLSAGQVSQGGGGSSGGFGGGGSSFAQGGPVGEGIPMTTGGYVPASASPSGGQQTDDVNAKLNAHEFVIPKDVALWKGQEHFQKLIDQSRQAMGTATAKPKMKPAQAGHNTFASHVMNRAPRQGIPTGGSSAR